MSQSLVEDPSGNLYVANQLSNRLESAVDNAIFNYGIAETEEEQEQLLSALVAIMLQSIFFSLDLSIRRGASFAVKEINRHPDYHIADDPMSRWAIDREMLNEIANSTIPYVDNTLKDIRTGDFEQAKTRATQIGRTETMTAFNESARYRYKAFGLLKFRILTHLDACTDDKVLRDGTILRGGCASLHGKTFPINERKYMPPFHPFCYSSDTEVLTKDGFIFFENLTGDELVATLNPETRSLEYQPIKRIIKYEYNGEMILYKNRNIDLLVTPDHRFPYISKWDNDTKEVPKIKWKLAKNLKTSDLLMRNCLWEGKINNPFPKFSLEPFIRFMAWWLSDGSETERKGIYQTKIAQEDKLDELIKDIKGLEVKLDIGKNGIYIFDKELGKYLMQFGKSYQKFIPQWIKDLPSYLLRMFLNTYVKADGYKKKGKIWKGYKFRDSYTYFTTSKRLSDGLGEIILKVGNHPSFRTQHPTEHTDSRGRVFKGKYPMDVISECYSKYSIVKPSYISKEDYNGTVWCVEAEKNHIIYVRRNGKCLWCGNCRCIILPVFPR